MPFNNTIDFYNTKVVRRTDMARNTRWRMKLPQTIMRFAGIGSQEDNWVDIHEIGGYPTIEKKISTTYYMGMPENHITGATINGTQSFKAYLREDMRSYTALLAWSEVQLNTGALVQEETNFTTPTEMARVNFTNAKSHVRLGLGTRKIPDRGTEESVSSDITTGYGNTATAVRSFNTDQTIMFELLDWFGGQPILRIYYINPKITKLELNGNPKWADTSDLMKTSCTFAYDRPVIYPVSAIDDDYYTTIAVNAAASSGDTMENDPGSGGKFKMQEWFS